MALNSLFCIDVPLRNYSLTHCSISHILKSTVQRLGLLGKQKSGDMKLQHLNGFMGTKQ